MFQLSEKLGLIAGNGKFPIIFAQRAKAKNFCVIAAGVKGDTSFLLHRFVDKMSFFHVGELKKMFDYFRDQGIKKVIMAGQVNPDHLFNSEIEFDEEFRKIFEALHNRKADTIFAAVAKKLSDQGMELMDSTFLLQDLLAPRGTLTSRGPTQREIVDMEFGRDIAKMMGGIDVGQTVLVKDKAIVAIEAMEGTDRAIIRGGRISREGAVVVKMSKPKQDFRFDVPVIGPRTVRKMIKVHASCLAIEAGKTIVIDRDLCVLLANKARICIVATN